MRLGWIVSPAFDLLFFINIYWVLAFLPFYASPDGEPYIQFWMAYFLATPHRWLTLVVAVTDKDRRYGMTWLFVAVAIVTAVLVGGTLWATGDFRSLFLFYTLLLGAHFAGQHATVLKIYSGRSGGGVRWMEDWLLLTFIVYVNVRLVTFLEPVLQLPRLNVLSMIDMGMLAIPLVMLGVELANFSVRRVPKLIYMLSVFGMWTSVLWTGTCTVTCCARSCRAPLRCITRSNTWRWSAATLGNARRLVPGVCSREWRQTGWLCLPGM